MFERFTDEARDVVIEAQRHSSRFGHGHIGTEHLLLALTACNERTAGVLADCGVTPAAIEGDCADPVIQFEAPLEADREALAGLGVDVDQVKDTIESTFGRGALERARAGRSRGSRRLARRRHQGRGAGPSEVSRRHRPFTPQAKSALERSLRHALRLKHRTIGPEHILLGLLNTNGLAGRILTRHEVSIADLRNDVEAMLAKAAA